MICNCMCRSRKHNEICAEFLKVSSLWRYAEAFYRYPLKEDLPRFFYRYSTGFLRVSRNKRIIRQVCGQHVQPEKVIVLLRDCWLLGNFLQVNSEVCRMLLQSKSEKNFKILLDLKFANLLVFNSNLLGLLRNFNLFMILQKC